MDATWPRQDPVICSTQAPGVAPGTGTTSAAAWLLTLRGARYDAFGLSLSR